MKRLWALMLLVGALILPGARAVSAVQSRPAPAVVYTVRPGDTLWRVAARVPGVEDRRRAVFDLMRLNSLSSADIQPGQRLTIPAR